MRVVTGKARGRRLKTPEGEAVRPTTDSVKEALFNIIQGDIEGRRVLDLFAGSGQLGIEALSRGAAETVFVDSSRDSVKLVKENLRLCGFEANVIQSDALKYLESCGRFDIIFVDPPYDSELYERVLEAVARLDLLRSGGVIMVEARKERALPDMQEPYVKKKEYNYGKVKLAVYERRAE